MTTLQKTSRANFIRQRRTSKTRTRSVAQNTGSSRTSRGSQQTTQTARRSYHPSQAYTSGSAHRTAVQPLNRAVKSPIKKGYDIAFSVGGTAVHAPTLAIPQFGTRWASGLLTLVLIFILYTMWTASAFTVNSADLQGNQRLTVADVNSVLSLVGQPIFKVVPSQVEADLRNSLPDLSSVKVIVGFPNRLTVHVVERTPILAWSYDGVVKWIDANGIAFTPRGEVNGLVQVTATGDPSKVPQDPTLQPYDQAYIYPAMVQALLTMAPNVPTGMTMAYDPVYGVGWQDPRGWSVYFGQDTKDIPTKLSVYQAIVDTLTRQGVQPTLISVENLNAPFYK